MLQGRALPLKQLELVFILLHMETQWEYTEDVVAGGVELYEIGCVGTPGALLSRIRLRAWVFGLLFEGLRNVELAAADVLEQLSQVLVEILLPAWFVL